MSYSTFFPLVYVLCNDLGVTCNLKSDRVRVQKPDS